MKIDVEFSRINNTRIKSVFFTYEFVDPDINSFNTCKCIPLNTRKNNMIY